MVKHVERLHPFWHRQNRETCGQPRGSSKRDTWLYESQLLNHFSCDTSRTRQGGPCFRGLGLVHSPGVSNTNERSNVATADHAVSGVAGRYANALFDLATEEKSVAETGVTLASFLAMIEESDDLRRLMSSPVFRTEDQMAAIDAIAAKTKMSGMALNFIKLMGQNRRLAAVPGAIAGYQALVAQSRGEVTAEVTSAEKLSAKQLADLKTALKASMGSDVVLSTKIDASLLGGLIVKVGSRMMDNSLKTKLQNLKVAMKGTQ
jgi:F-type H+-transporting ATPase subunit delta